EEPTPANRIVPSARIEEQIETQLVEGISDPDRLTEVGRLGAHLILQRARYERTAKCERSRNGTRPRRVPTAKGELKLAIPPASGSSRQSGSANAIPSADWLDLGRNSAKRGLRGPWLAVSDGAPRLIKAIDEVWPGADRQRCTLHYADLRIMPTWPASDIQTA